MQRIEYIDFMKGIAIFLVVLGHVYQFCFKDTGQVFQFIYIFHMPFFFLLSGYFAQRTRVNVDFFKKKTISLLFPFVFGGSLFALLMGRCKPTYIVIFMRVIGFFGVCGTAGCCSLLC